MRIWFISDTHNQHAGLRVPDDIDWVIHCGDEANAGPASLNEPESRRFFGWFAELDIPTKFFTPGNHSTAIEQGFILPSDYPEVTFLIHDQVTFGGLKIFGTPYTPTFFDWAYMKPRQELDALWQSIPSDTDILVSHGPPKGIRDVTKDMDTGKPIHVGSKSLTRHVEERIKPRVHAFGHIHDERDIKNFGSETREGTLFINCACCDLRGRLANHGVVVEL